MRPRHGTAVSMRPVVRPGRDERDVVRAAIDEQIHRAHERRRAGAAVPLMERRQPRAGGQQRRARGDVEFRAGQDVANTRAPKSRRPS